MSTEAQSHATAAEVLPHHSKSPWAPIIYDELMAAGIKQVGFVPDAGHTELISMLQQTPGVRTTVLTTEEEGIALCVGAWLGGQRSVMLMQSSGVGNCVNMLSLIASCRTPFLTVVTMRGEWGEFNPWQVPMGRAVEQAFEIMGTRVVRVDRLEDLEDTVSAAAAMAFDGDQSFAIILSQRLLGRKKWVAK